MANITVNKGDVFEKAGRSYSKYIVDKMMTYADIPPHVRLIEQGGNDRTVTVALATLLDEKYWKRSEL